MIRIGSRQPEQMQDGAFSARSIGWVGHGGCILTSHDSPMVDQVWLNIKVCFLEQVRWQQSKTWLQVTAPTPCHVPPPPRVSLINWQTKNTGHNLILPGGRGGGEKTCLKKRGNNPSQGKGDNSSCKSRNTSERVARTSTLSVSLLSYALSYYYCPFHFIPTYNR